MGRFVNPDNTTFKAALNTKIYVDDTERKDNYYVCCKV